MWTKGGCTSNGANKKAGRPWRVTKSVRTFSTGPDGIAGWWEAKGKSEKRRRGKPGERRSRQDGAGRGHATVVGRQTISVAGWNKRDGDANDRGSQRGYLMAKAALDPRILSHPQDWARRTRHAAPLGRGLGFVRRLARMGENGRE